MFKECCNGFVMYVKSVTSNLHDANAPVRYIHNERRLPQNLTSYMCIYFMIENMVNVFLPDGWAGQYDIIHCLLSLCHKCLTILAF